MDHFANWIKSLNRSQIERFGFLSHVVMNDSEVRADILEEQYGLRRSFALGRYKTYKEFANHELFNASDELTRADLEIYWPELRDWLQYSRESMQTELLNTDYGVRNFEALIPYLFYLVASQIGLLSYYMDLEIDTVNTPTSEFDTKTVRDLDKIIDFLGRFRWIVRLQTIIANEEYDEIPKERRSTLTFAKLFNREGRANIPKEVIRLLGPGQADGWDYNDTGKMVWVYGKLKSSVVIPFHLLVEMGYIKLDTRLKAEYIKTWLKEFGIAFDIKERKRYDKPPKAPEETDHFLYYLGQLRK